MNSVVGRKLHRRFLDEGLVQVGLEGHLAIWWEIVWSTPR